MTLLVWALWAVLLFAQNAANTLVSRARNSGSYGYHAIAAVFSNGVWIVGQFVLLGALVDILKRGAWWQAAGVVLFYTACTVTGSLAMHYVSVTYIETGKRRVGA